MTFVDTSALICVLDEAQQDRLRAVRSWQRLVDERETLVTTNYVCLETWAVLQARVGLAAVRKFNDDILPVIDVRDVSGAQLSVGKNAVLTLKRRNLSLVDGTSFAVMRDEGIERAFAFDRHFAEQGFTVL